MPAIPAIIVAGAAIASAVMSARAAKKAAKEAAAAQERGGTLQSQVSESEAGLVDYNAQVADLQALDAIERGAEEEHRFRSMIRGTIGAQRAGQAAGNIDVSYGSAVDVQADAAFLGEWDALTIRTNAALEAWGFSVQGEDLRRRAAILRQEGVNLKEMGSLAAQATIAGGKAEARAAYIQMGGSLASTAASYMQQRYGFARAAK